MVAEVRNRWYVRLLPTTQQPNPAMIRNTESAWHLRSYPAILHKFRNPHDSRAYGLLPPECIFLDLIELALWEHCGYLLKSVYFGNALSSIHTNRFCEREMLVFLHTDFIGRIDMNFAKMYNNKQIIYLTREGYAF